MEPLTISGKPASLVFAVVEMIRRLPDGEYDIGIRDHKEKRSLSQNAYYWQLLGQLAGRLRMSKTELHNRILRDYGQLARMDGALVPVLIPDTDKAERLTLAAETYHIKPTSGTMTGKNGKRYRQYVMLRGSHEYNTEEMSQLLDGMIQEAQAQGIQTLTPDQLARMRQDEAEAEKRRNG